MAERSHKSRTLQKIEIDNFSPYKDKVNENDILGDFIIGETLGKGTFGKVKLGIHKITGEKVFNKNINSYFFR
jgi:serine/threonine protein kinase